MRIPDADLSVGPQTATVPQAQFARPIASAFTAEAEAIQGAGAMGEKVAGAFTSHLLEKQRQKDEADLANIDSNFMLSLQDKLYSADPEKVSLNGAEIERPKGILNRQLGAADGSAVEFEQSMSSEIPKIVAAGRTPEMQAKIKQRLTSSYVNARENIIRHEATQNRQSHVDAIEANQLKRIGEAASIMTPDSLLASVKVSNTNADELSSLKSLDPTSAEMYRRGQAAKIAETAAVSALSGPDGLKGALAMTEAVKDQMTPDAYKDLQASLTTKWNTLESARLTMEDRARKETKIAIAQKAATGNYSLADFQDAAAAGVFETPAELNTYKELAIKGFSGTASTDATTMKVLMDEMLTLGQPSKELAEKGVPGGKAVIAKLKPNITAEKVAQFQGKVLQMNRDGVLSQDDATKMIGATEKIYAMALRNDVSKFKNPLQHFMNFIGTAQDDFDPDIQKRKQDLQRRYLERAVIGGENPDTVIADLKNEHVRSQKHPSYAIFNGKAAGDEVVYNGRKFKFLGIGADGEPQVSEIK